MDIILLTDDAEWTLHKSEPADAALIAGPASWWPQSEKEQILDLSNWSTYYMVVTLDREGTEAAWGILMISLEQLKISRDGKDAAAAECHSMHEFGLQIWCWREGGNTEKGLSNPI